MAVFVNPFGELREFPESIRDDIYQEPIVIFNGRLGTHEKNADPGRPAVMLWRRVEPWDVAELKGRRGMR